MISASQLLERLAQGHAAAITVVTPNRRLAHALTLDFDSFQTAKNLQSWEAADILPFDSFVERLWQDAMYSDAGEKLRLLLTAAQEQLIWERVLEKSGLLIVPRAAAQCRDAWRLIHQWRIPAGQGNEDSAAFSRWSAAYRKETANDVDLARLPDLISQYLKQVKVPRLLVAYGFDVLPPQTKEFLDQLEWTECKPDLLDGKSLRTSFASAKQELEAAAKWARARLEEGRQRIGVVVPDLGRRRQEAVRVFSRVMRPGYNLPGAKAAAMPFNVSLGRPLSAFPLVDAALTLLRISYESIPFAEASSLLRSPFLGGADSELAKRATLDVRLRRDADGTISLPKLVAASESVPLLRKHLEAVFDLTKTKVDAPGDWARQFSAVLDAAGFPGERSPDSDEFQTRAKWHEALGELARLERIAQKMSFDEALGFLERHCDGTLFQPAHFSHGPDAPIQVLGILESAGQRFDCLWVSGLTDDAWPLATTPNPFIPIALQKKAGIPRASAEGSLSFAKELTEQWSQSAREVVFSYPEREEDRDFAPSPLIEKISRAELKLPDFPRYRDVLFANRKLETFEDRKAPAAKPGKVIGGTKVLADQAACPFRAFARWRLGARELEEPAEGLDARDRGKLLHALMREIFSRVRDSNALKTDLTVVINQAAAEAVKEMGLEGKFAELERQRLAKLAREWLQVESKRADFEVLFVEQQRDIKLLDFEFQSRIDRMDRLSGGGHALIDYKTGLRVTPDEWMGERPDDPQLPLYAVSAPERLEALVFAKLRAGEMRFMGFSEKANVLPQVKQAESWPGLMAGWKKTVEALASDFAEGKAEVDPKEIFKTCRRCELHTLCRVYERKNPLTEEK